MNLTLVPSRFTDQAWKDGANALSEACEEECTIDQLKFLISKEERHLVRVDFEGETVGWAVFRVEQLPNMRVFFITNLVGRGMQIGRFWDEVKQMAESLGCSRVRCAAKPALERLYRQKLGLQPVYQILEMKL